MIRKIAVNALIAYILFPIFLGFRHWNDILNGIQYGVYRNDYRVYETFSEYLSDYLHSLAYPLVPTIFSLIVLLPFQLIKDRFNESGKPLGLLVKCIIFIVILLLVYFFLITRGHMRGFWLPVICFAITYTLILYYSVDRYVERPQPDEK